VCWLSGLVIGAFASLLKLLLAIERNTAEIAENTAPPHESVPLTPEEEVKNKSWIRTVFTPVRPSIFP
jgi:hypothetical protein